MKVKLTVELDIPDDTPLLAGHERASLGELLSDAYTRYVTVRHCTDAMKWLVAAKLGTPNEDAMAARLYKHHDAWADICDKAEWSFEVVGEAECS